MDIDRIFALAEQVHAGSEVDWRQQADSSDDESEKEIIRSMGVLVQIADLHSGRHHATARDETTVKYDNAAVGDDGLPVSRRWGHLEQLEFIGKGGFGIVCKAWDPTLQRWVALKLARGRLDADSHEQEILEEARLMARVCHENVIRIYGTATHDGRPGIWMEFIEGRTLAQIVEYEGQMDERRVIVLGRVLARALAVVHAAHVVHKDVKAHNVMLESGGRLVLMDFGSSARLGDLKGDPSNEPLRGTPHYFAPELFDDYAPSNQSDIYSLGVLLFFLLTKRYPIEAGSLSDLMKAHRNGEYRSLADLRPGIDPRLCRVIDRAMQPIPADRFESAGRMALELSDANQDPVRWRRLVLVALLLGAVGVVAVNLWPGSYSVEASLYRAGSPRLELRSGSGVQIEDQLYLEVEASAPLYVYVFNQDDNGVSSLLFPIPGLQPQNPIEPDQLHQLPGVLDSQQVNWVVTSAGQRERFWIVGSRKRIDELETLIDQLPKASFDQPIEYPTVDDNTLMHLRGIAGLAKDKSLPPAPDHSADLEFFDRITELTDQKTRQRGTWVRRIELANP